MKDGWKHPSAWNDGYAEYWVGARLLGTVRVDLSPKPRHRSATYIAAARVKGTDRATFERFENVEDAKAWVETLAIERRLLEGTDS